MRRKFKTFDFQDFSGDRSFGEFKLTSDQELSVLLCLEKLKVLTGEEPADEVEVEDLECKGTSIGALGGLTTLELVKL